MSSFNNLFNRMETLNEAKTSPYAAAHSSFGDVTKQMRASGLSSAPLDTIKFIREILFNLDVISEEELQAVKSAKGFTGKKQAMLAVLHKRWQLKLGKLSLEKRWMMHLRISFLMKSFLLKLH